MLSSSLPAEVPEQYRSERYRNYIRDNRLTLINGGQLLPLTGSDLNKATGYLRSALRKRGVPEKHFAPILALNHIVDETGFVGESLNIAIPNMAELDRLAIVME